MERIWKFPLEFDTEQTITAPGLTPISTAMQHEKVTIWGEVNYEKPKLTWRVFVVGTGDEKLTSVLNQGAKFLGTVLDEIFVWHIYIVPVTPLA